MAGKSEVDTSGSVLEPPPGLDPICYLFLGDPENKTFSELERMWMPVSCAVAFGICSLVANKGSSVPLRSGMHKHVLWTIFGSGFGEGAWRLKQKMDSEKDLQYFHYMTLHPEDFKAPERKKWAEVMRPWIPFR